MNLLDVLGVEAFSGWCCKPSVLVLQASMASSSFASLRCKGSFGT